ncbi:hypothetical protein [Archaeoglobus sp.]
MMMRYVPPALVGLLLLVATANGALLFNATPNFVVVTAGGYSNVTIKVTDTLNTTFYTLTYVINNPNVTASLDGPYLDPNFTITTPFTTTTVFSTTGGILWKGWAGTTYYFKLTFTSTTAGQAFSCGITAITYGKKSVNVNGTILPGSVIPELDTGALVAIGMVSILIGLVRRQS